MPYRGALNLTAYHWQISKSFAPENSTGPQWGNTLTPTGGESTGGAMEHRLSWAHASAPMSPTPASVMVDATIQIGVPYDVVLPVCHGPTPETRVISTVTRR